MASLVHSRVPDPSGTLIPSNIDSGSAVLAGAGGETDTISVAVSASVFNVRNATCGGQCVTCNGATEAAFDPGSYAEAVAGTAQSQMQVTWNTGNVYTNPSGTNWSISNSSIATINTSGMMTGQSPGETGASFVLDDYPIYAVDCSNYEPCPYANPGGGASDAVGPSIASITPSAIPINGNVTQLTISGTGFGSAPTINLPTGVSLTGSSTNSEGTQITANVVAGNNAQVGNSSITVTANGVSSNAQNEVLDGPFTMRVTNDTWGICTGCTTTIYRTIAYQVVNFSGSNAGAATLCESPSLTGNNCSPTPSVVSNQCSVSPVNSFDGTFRDTWGISTDNVSPTNCGVNVTDTWFWYYTSPTTPIGKPAGYVHTNAIQVDGVTTPNALPNGTVMPK
jgi:hypothetical protein